MASYPLRDLLSQPPQAQTARGSAHPIPYPSLLKTRLQRSVSVDVWVVEIADQGPLGLRAAQELLTPAERSAADRHRRAEDRSRAAISRAALRRLVAFRAGIEPRAVSLDRDVRGRPVVLEPSGLRATVSHSGSFIACAVARRDVGIDIERDDRSEADEQLADRVCTPDESAQLRGTPARQRRRGLVRLWTRKEAFAKALGVGLELPFETLDVRLETPVVSGHVGRGWRIIDLHAPAGYQAALAVRARNVSIRAQTFHV